ncbi:glycosyltransferase family 9 protein (plasmid) [Aeromonas dhakensis]|uniref:glycosyltransferase family 9 protein n=1 Tax=Aeromonas dhakensis TaxID=196024 RepID=UPI0021B262A7|nr:glycosyltransferase family 9 protein [Aeromonas dhakensis]UXB09959.1 glycosyltransferase family 9 protein [Aeromonas dhakensis]
MSKYRDILRRFDGQRRQWTSGVERLLLVCLARGSRLPSDELPPRRILVVRSNNRIGNNLFLLPFLQQVQKSHPGAEVELVCSKGPLLPLFDTLNLHRIHLVRLQGKGLFKALPTLLQLRQQRYDLVYVPFASSTDHLLAAWVRGREKLGFDDAKGDAIFVRPEPIDEDRHYAYRPLRLLGVDVVPEQQIVLGLPVATSHPQLTELAREHPGQPLIGFFTGARKGKGLTLVQWQRLLAQLRQQTPNAVMIQFNDPVAPLPLVGDATLSLASLCEFATVTARLSLFVSCDTGPLHLAAASGVPCLGLFTQTDPRHYGCLGAQHHNLVVEDRDQIAFDIEWLHKAITRESGAVHGGGGGHNQKW